MGVMARQRDGVFVITSDRLSADSPGKGAPKRASEADAVWTGSGWSLTLTEAMTFPSLDAADEYVRANYGRVMKDGGTTA
jgi:hypothetical protein